MPGECDWFSDGLTRYVKMTVSCQGIPAGGCRSGILKVLVVEAASSRDFAFKADSFRGWKPLPRDVET